MRLQFAAGEPVSHLVFVRERPVGHQRGITPEFKATGHPRARLIRTHIGHFPQIGGLQHAVDRHVILVNPQHTERFIERVPVAAGVEAAARDTIRPRRQKRNTAELTQVGNTRRRHMQDIRATHIHRVRSIAERRRNQNFHAMRLVGQTDHADAMILRSLCCVGWGAHHCQCKPASVSQPV